VNFKVKKNVIYFLNNNGVKQTGWLSNGGKWYYLDSYGEMVTGQKFIDNNWYYFNDNGVWIG